MAIIKCPECGHPVSDKAPTCPTCGVEIAGKITTCTNCGTAYFSNLNMCPNCHCPNPRSVATPSVPTTQKGATTPPVPTIQPDTVTSCQRGQTGEEVQPHHLDLLVHLCTHCLWHTLLFLSQRQRATGRGSLRIRHAKQRSGRSSELSRHLQGCRPGSYRLHHVAPQRPQDHRQRLDQRRGERFKRGNRSLIPKIPQLAPQTGGMEQNRLHRLAGSQESRHG